MADMRLRFAFATRLFSSVSAQSAALIAEPRAGESGLLGTVFGNPIDVPHWNKIVVVLAKRNRAQYGVGFVHLFQLRQ